MYNIEDPENAVLVTEDIFEGGWGCYDVVIHPTKPLAIVATRWG